MGISHLFLPDYIKIICTFFIEHWPDFSLEVLSGSTLYVSVVTFDLAQCPGRMLRLHCSPETSSQKM